MIRTHLLLLTLLLTPLFLLSQNSKYSVESIPPELTENATVVIREYTTKVVINSLHSESIEQHLVLTVLKGSASEYTKMEVPYDNWSDVDQLEGNIYNKEGVLIKKLGKKETIDVSAIDNGMLYSDDRIQSIEPDILNYPVTVEYFVKLSIRKRTNFPRWMPMSGFGVSLENASLTIETKEDLFPRVMSRNIPQSAVVIVDGNAKRSWVLSNLSAVKEEPLCSPISHYVPVIFLEPTKYAMKRFAGDFSSWKSFGEWIALLNESRDSLDPATIQKVQSLVQSCKNDREKVKLLYQYMQSTCRYVSVSVGLSGVQSEKATTVARLGYGDCKGLVMYTSALLKAVGITSYYTLVNSGDVATPINRDFPGDQFDHIILCVPFSPDTIWLECTNQKQSFGFLGSFTCDRDVLLITPDGGVIAHTPTYSKMQNRRNSKIVIQVDSLSNAKVELKGAFSALRSEDILLIQYMPFDDQKAWFRKDFGIPELVIATIQFKTTGDYIPTITETLQLNAPHFTSKSGERTFIPFNKFVDSPGILKKDNFRKLDFVLNYAYSDVDTTLIEIPVGYSIESIPPPAKIETAFGRYTSETVIQGTVLQQIRSIELEKGNFPADQFNNFVEFLKQVSKQDKTMAVIVKK